MYVTMSLKIEAIQKKISLLIFFKLVNLLGLKENESQLKEGMKEGEIEGREGKSKEFFELNFTALTHRLQKGLVITKGKRMGEDMGRERKGD